MASTSSSSTESGGPQAHPLLRIIKLYGVSISLLEVLPSGEPDVKLRAEEASVQPLGLLPKRMQHLLPFTCPLKCAHDDARTVHLGTTWNGLSCAGQNEVNRAVTLIALARRRGLITRLFHSRSGPTHRSQLSQKSTEGEGQEQGDQRRKKPRGRSTRAKN